MMAVRYHGCTCHMRYGGIGVAGRGGVRGGDSNGNAGKDSYDGCSGGGGGAIGGDKEAGAEDRDTDEEDKGKSKYQQNIDRLI